jgi:phosphate-selective porin OprO/OprP
MEVTAMSDGDVRVTAMVFHEHGQIPTRTLSVIADFRLLAILLLLIGRSVSAQETPLVAPTPATPAVDDETTRALRDVLAEQARLRARLAAAEARLAAAEADHASSPRVLLSLGPNGFSLSTRDGGFQLRLRSVVQADGRAFLNAAQQKNDTFLIRRARLYVEGSIGDHFDYRLMPDFAGGTLTLFDAWVNVRFWRFFQIRAGKFKSPFSFERLQQEQNVLMNERSLVSAIAPDRDVGVSLHGEIFDRTLEWDLAVMNGVPDGGSSDLDLNFGKDYVVRAFAYPLRTLKNKWIDTIGLGVAYSYGKAQGNATNTGLGPLKTAGQQTFFSWFVDSKSLATAIADGDHWRVNPQLALAIGPATLLAEYILASNDVAAGTLQGVVRNQAWNIQASAVLTGERGSFEGILPRRPFGIKKRGPGAFELVARINELRVDDRAFPSYADPTKSAKRAFAWGVHLNWYLSRNFRFGALFERTIFDGGAASGGFRPTENVLIGRLQASF